MSGSDWQGFEGDHKRVLANSRAQIAKMEANSKKAGKKGGAALQEVSRLFFW